MANLLINRTGISPISTSTIAGLKASRPILVKAFQLFNQLLKTAPLASKSHMQDHSIRMLNNLQVIGVKAGDLTILEAAIPLHDIGLFYSQDPCHGPESAKLVRPHLDRMGLTPKEIDRVCSVIRAHDDVTFIDNSPEAKALRVLDALDAFGNIGIYRYLEIYRRRGFKPPQIFEKSLQSVAQKYMNVTSEWFELADQRVVYKAYRRAYDLINRMHLDSTGLGQGRESMQILFTLASVDFDLASLVALLMDDPLHNYPLAKEYFKGLIADLEVAGSLLV